MVSSVNRVYLNGENISLKCCFFPFEKIKQTVEMKCCIIEWHMVFTWKKNYVLCHALCLLEFVFLKAVKSSQRMDDTLLFSQQQQTAFIYDDLLSLVSKLYYIGAWVTFCMCFVLVTHQHTLQAQSDLKQCQYFLGHAKQNQIQEVFAVVSYFCTDS